LLRFADDQKLKLTVSFLFVILTSSATLLRWVVADLTDSLHLFLFTLCCLGIYKRWRFQYLFLIVLLGSLARPMGILWAALFFSCSIRDVNNARKNYFVLAITSMSLFLLNTLLMAIYGGFGPNSKSLSGQILSVPSNFISLVVVEFGQLAVLDRVLFYLVLLSMALAASRMSDPWSLIHFNVTLASFLLSAWIGVWGVNFRYQLPVLATAVIVMIRFPYLKRILSLK
jgi:hypothetical protein